MTGAINSPGGVDSTYRLGDVGKAKFGEKKPVDSQGSSIPPTINDFLKKMGLPVLSTPAGGMSLDTLVSAIGNEVRKQACRDGVESLEARAKDQQEINDKQLEQLEKQLEKMKQKKVLGKFAKAFQIIGAIIGAIASVATVAAGVMTANPLMVGAGLAMGVMAIDGIVSAASDGKYSIAAGFAELGKILGMSDEAAQWFGFGIQMTMTVATIALSFGAGFASSATTAATSAAAKTFNLVQQGISIATGAVGIGSGSAQIAGAVFDYQIAKTQISAKEFEAILERIQAAMEVERGMIEAETERANNLMSKVMDIVKGNNQTQTAILTSSPAMA